MKLKNQRAEIRHKFETRRDGTVDRLTLEAERRKADRIVMGDRPENWQNSFFLDHLAGGIRWTLGEVTANIPTNLRTVAPGYADIPPQQPKKS